MKVNISSVHFDADQKLLEFIEKKVKKLYQFHENILGAEVILKIDANDEIGNKITEIRLNIPGDDLFAKKQSKTFEEATDLAVDALRMQITKVKTKRRL
jgi:putative sigma-54 modulation protein